MLLHPFYFGENFIQKAVFYKIFCFNWAPFNVTSEQLSVGSNPAHWVRCTLKQNKEVFPNSIININMHSINDICFPFLFIPLGSGWYAPQLAHPTMSQECPSIIDLWPNNHPTSTNLPHFHAPNPLFQVYHKNISFTNFYRITIFIFIY